MIPIPNPWTRASWASCTVPEMDCARILVVEDDLMVGAVAAEALEDAGFVVLTAASAEEAEVILDQETVDVLFTDIDLGGRDGCDLAHRALRTQPDLPVILASGRSQRCHSDRIPAGATFLAKPYGLPQMIREVHRAAQGRSAP
ncbi:response regulator [Microvirga sp. 3-52]|nr:response regulator [Microvirga sp. 3-52]